MDFTPQQEAVMIKDKLLDGICGTSTELVDENGVLSELEFEPSDGHLGGATAEFVVADPQWAHKKYRVTVEAI